MKSRYSAILGVLVLILAGYWILQFFGGETPAHLATQALSADKLEARINAAVELSQYKEADGLRQMRRVATESKDSQVKATALRGLAAQSDTVNVPLFLDAMDDSDQGVRDAGAKGLAKTVLSADESGYRADDPPEKRTVAMLQVRKLAKQMTARPGDGTVPEVPPASVSSDTGEAKKDVPAVATPSPSSAPTVSGPGSTPLLPNEYPAVNLLVWMFRVLAVLVMLADVAGLMILVLSASARSAKDARAAAKQPLTVAEEVERAVAKNSAGTWAKIALLFTGAIAVVGLLAAAEAMQLIVRVEQNTYMSRVR